MLHHMAPHPAACLQDCELKLFPDQHPTHPTSIENLKMWTRNARCYWTIYSTVEGHAQIFLGSNRLKIRYGGVFYVFVWTVREWLHHVRLGWNYQSDNVICPLGLLTYEKDLMSFAHSQVHQNPRPPTRYVTSCWAITSKHFVGLNAIIHIKVV